ncbi:p53-induced death domain-containing protein 1 [Protopterus annectens]|uniref:p53-induced death domain-containing protein 1 n=1 Tax=Protopterus annectens TaxID=7888 RepID=UPI001CFBB6AE|nr:p53-induced death domain-containing protein 1 [Protopterus annectens]
MAEQLLVGEPDTGSATDTFMAGNRLNLDVYPQGCSLFTGLIKKWQKDLLQVEFLRLNCNEEDIFSAVTLVPALQSLKSVVLKGGHVRDRLGICQRGFLCSLPESFGQLKQLSHLDLSFNSFSALPECITELCNLSALLLCHNQLSSLPESINRLSKLTFLSVMKNDLQELPRSIGELRVLHKLDVSENVLQTVPDEIGNLVSCTELDLSGNVLQKVPESVANLVSLLELHLQCNCLVTIPAGIASLPNLTKLELQNNSLRFIPPEILNLPFVNLKGNPIGKTETSEQQDEVAVGELQCFYLTSDNCSFTVTVEGCKIFLPCGIRLHFPREAVGITTDIHCRLLGADPKWVKLTHHDIVLSDVLELQPHGTEFQQEVYIWIPYVSSRATRSRELVVRTYNGHSWSDLDTTALAKHKRRCMVCCRVFHFSWFLVVSRIVEDQCTVPQEGTLLFSSVIPDIKVTFPPGATDETRSVKMQVLPISAQELCEITEDQDSIVSPLVCLSQNTNTDFLKPVKIQLPLPPGVTGLNVDRSRLHLLHGDQQAQTWTDITSQVVLELTHLFVLFEVNHFSWYWLWYTTKTYVGGIAKKVYERLRMYQVNFIALQRKKDPEQVLLQCTPKHKVESVLKKLHDRYHGPEPSDFIGMFEGEQFFAAFEKGIEIDSDRPDCVAGRLVFVFYSHLKNVKEVYVTSAVNRQEQAVKGQVSFYRGAIPEGVPEDAVKRRKGPDSQWMATLLLKLPKLKSRSHNPQSPSYPPLNLGNAETGYLTEANLLSIARRIGTEWREIGMNLGLSYEHLERIGYNNREDLDRQILEMLFSWARKNMDAPDSVKRLIEAMQDSGRQDIADEIESIIDLGKQKYQDSIRRVGLDQGSSTEDSAIVVT